MLAFRPYFITKSKGFSIYSSKSKALTVFMNPQGRCFSHGFNIKALNEKLYESSSITFKVTYINDGATVCEEETCGRIPSTLQQY